MCLLKTYIYPCPASTPPFLLETIFFPPPSALGDNLPQHCMLVWRSCQSKCTVLPLTLDRKRLVMIYADGCCLRRRLTALLSSYAYSLNLPSLLHSELFTQQSFFFFLSLLLITKNPSYSTFKYLRERTLKQMR